MERRASPQLDSVAVAGLRRVIARLRDRGDGTMPHHALLLLTHELTALSQGSAALTVDLGVEDREAAPLIIVWPSSVQPVAPSVLACLSAREHEVANLIARGHSNKEIAARLGIRTSTVKDHVHHILSRTGLPGRAAIVIAWYEDQRGRE